MMFDAAWLNPPQPLTAAGDEVHVWRSSLDLPPPAVERLAAVLAPDEGARADRFHREKDRAHYVTARGLLRRLLGGYLNRDPAGLRFASGPQGKPFLPVEAHGDLRFNLSHSRGLALIAVTRGREVGVDVEVIRPEMQDDALAERYFSPDEVAQLRAVPTADRKEAFFRCWTRKEAYIKATGRGLSLPLDGFCVSLLPGAPAALLGTAWKPEERARWSMAALEPGPGYVGAVAVEGTGWRLRCFALPVP